MTEAMPFLQKFDITFLRPPTIPAGLLRSQGGHRPGSVQIKAAVMMLIL